MKLKTITKLVIIVSSLGLVTGITGCFKSKSTQTGNHKDMIVVDNGEDAPTLDPALTQDTQSSRVIYDLFEGLTSFDQKMQTIPGLAETWDISKDQLTYTFHLRQDIKFSDGTPITANDVVFSFQRIVDPKVASPYNILGSNIVNGQAIIDNKLPPSALAVSAIDKSTVQIKLVHPDASFLAICAMPNLGIVSKSNINKYGNNDWTQPGKMVNSGAYKLTEWVIKGYILLSKNSYYYDAKDVSINQVKFMPIVDFSSSLSQYKSGNIDITYRLPIDQYKTIKREMPEQEHTVTQEGLYYYDLNMTLPKFRDNLKLRQALSMAVDRSALVKVVLGQDQVPAYSYVTSTVEAGKFAGLDYDWGKWSRDKQITEAQKLFKDSGYGPNNPLEISISYNTNDLHKKVALAIGSMWQEVFGENSIHVTIANQEWKTFLKARNTANYDVARDGWITDYDSVDSYTNLYQCGNPQNNSKMCNKEYNNLLAQAQQTANPEERIDLIRKAIQIAMDEYGVIPLYQYTYYRLINPKVKGYEIEGNHLDHVQSKWYKF